MIIVAGHLVVDSTDREAYLETCRAVVDAARTTKGCLDFAITADLQDAARVNVYERWSAREPLDSFRGAGVGDDQATMIRSASVAEYDVRNEALLF